MRADTQYNWDAFYHWDVNKRACMLWCHWAWRLKFVAQPNYIFIIANGSRCPITALQYISNNMHQSVWLSIWAGLSNSPSWEKCQAADSEGELRWWKGIACVCEKGGSLGSLFLFYSVISLWIHWPLLEKTKTKNQYCYQVQIAMQSLFIFLFTRRHRTAHFFSSQTFTGRLLDLSSLQEDIICIEICSVGLKLMWSFMRMCFFFFF